MADGKLDLLDDLISSRPSDQTWIPKGNDEDKSMIGLLDFSKDQAVPDSSIPLSPQWLYAKPSDTKTWKNGMEEVMRLQLGKKTGFRRTASCGDAEVTETSFSDMLKSNAKKPPQAQEVHSSTAASDAFDAAQGARRNKKKGKKGRQIDLALLGFKVTSNRIMMGRYSA